MSDRPSAIGNLYTCLCYDDAPRAIEFLERAFGFKRRLVVPGPNGTVRHSQLAREEQDEEYGSRGYTAPDCDGNEWYFGTYAPGVHSEQGEA